MVGYGGYLKDYGLRTVAAFIVHGSVKVDVHVLSGRLRGGISACCWFTCIHVDKAPTFGPCVGKDDIAEGKREWHQGEEEERERERERERGCE